MPRRPPISPLFPYTTLFRSDAADRRALHAVEPGDGARRHEDSRALRLRESDPILAAEQRAAGEHDEVAAGAERLRGDLVQVRLRGRLDHQIRGGHEGVEVEKGRPRLEAREERLGALARPGGGAGEHEARQPRVDGPADLDRKSTRLNSSHTVISYAVFCL